MAIAYGGFDSIEVTAGIFVPSDTTGHIPDDKWALTFGINVTGSYFVGAPDVTTLPLLLYSAGAGGNYQIASITALLLLVPSIAFMLVVEKFLRADVLAKVGQ